MCRRRGGVRESKEADTKEVSWEKKKKTLDSVVTWVAKPNSDTVQQKHQIFGVSLSDAVKMIFFQKKTD